MSHPLILALALEFAADSTAPTVVERAWHGICRAVADPHASVGLAAAVSSSERNLPAFTQEVVRELAGRIIGEGC